MAQQVEVPRWAWSLGRTPGGGMWKMGMVTCVWNPRTPSKRCNAETGESRDSLAHSNNMDCKDSWGCPALHTCYGPQMPSNVNMCVNIHTSICTHTMYTCICQYVYTQCMHAHIYMSIHNAYTHIYMYTCNVCMHIFIWAYTMYSHTSSYVYNVYTHLYVCKQCIHAHIYMYTNNVYMNRHWS